MCWSLEVSLTAGLAVVLIVPFLWLRNATPRDRWNAIFLSVFGSMQLVDAGLWFLDSTENLNNCSKTNTYITRLAFFVISMEPISCLVGMCYSKKRWPTPREALVYFAMFIVVPCWPSYAPFFKPHRPECAGPACTFVTENRHLMYSTGHDLANLEHKCWLTYIFFGEPMAEIPVQLRVAFLLGMIYPYLHAVPTASGLIQCAILTATWMVGFMSDAHASVWCLANVAQIITFLLDPYLFPPSKPGSPITRGKHEPMTQDRYRANKVPDNLDAIVIGSGIGGLACAAMLAKAGKKVLVLEQHYRAGGCTHTFDELGNLFDSGIHYVGAKNDIDMLMSLIADVPVKMAQMGSEKDGFCYDEFDLGSDKGGKETKDVPHLIRYRAGRDQLIRELLREFPHEKEGIRKYFEFFDSSANTFNAFLAIKVLPKWLLRFAMPALHAHVLKYTSRTADEVVAQFIKDARLRALLTGGQLIDWNLRPSKVSWWVVGSMMRYYIHGAYYPEGGSHTIAEAIIPTIEKAGGRVLCRAKVEKILVDDDSKRAYGVLLENGDYHTAPIIVSDAGGTNTYERLLDPKYVENMGLKPKIPCVGLSNSHMTAFVSLDGPCEKFGLRPANIHSMPGLPKYDYDVSALQEAFYKDPFINADDALMTFTCPAAKDPRYEEHFPGKSNVLLLMEAQSTWFKEFESDQYKHRSEGYEEFKKKFIPIFLKRMYKYYPLTEGHVESIEIGTPLTARHFLGSVEGESYGLEWAPDRFNSKLYAYSDARTRLEGLYLTGEFTLVGGFVGAMASGVVSAYKILGIPRFLWTMLTSNRL